MAKELTHRGDELKDLGWSLPEITRYIELWDYRQRWGAINLERDDRQFLRRAESALPIIKSGKPSIKKPIKDKSYYKRLFFFLNSMNSSEVEFDKADGSRGLWPILLEEELRALDYFQPVLGLPDTLKAKKLIPFREEVISTAEQQYRDQIKNFSFNFSSVLSGSIAEVDKNWKPLRDSSFDEDQDYPIISKEHIASYRKDVRDKVVSIIKSTLPSLSDTDKPLPSDDWIPDSSS